LAGAIPTHIKIDVEGFEGEVLAGAAEFLRVEQPVVYLELHGDILREKGLDPEQVLGGLVDCGYGTFIRDGKPLGIAGIAGLPIARLVCLPG
jgi:hypothetical protein